MAKITLNNVWPYGKDFKKFVWKFIFYCENNLQPEPFFDEWLKYGMDMTFAELKPVSTWNSCDLIGNAVYNPCSNSIVIHKCNLDLVVVPIEWFFEPEFIRNIIPNIYDLRVIDGGNTLCLGEYEVAADAIFQEFR